MINFSVPTNWDDKLISKINKTNIEEFYGKFESDYFGGGRPSLILPHVSKSAAERHIKIIHSFKIKFNYLLNSSCLGNEEWTRAGQKKINKMLTWLADNKVEKVTVAIPYLAEVIKKRFPEIKIVISELAGVSSVERVRFWERLGADEFNFSFIYGNRNFEIIRAIRNSSKLKIKLIANLLCLRGCPFSRYHGNSNAHASQNNTRRGRFIIDYCSAKCKLMRLEQPWQIIRSGWIRPEDVKYYEDLGVNSLKFVDRAMKTEYLESIVEAYTKRNYKGNLMDLFSSLDKNLGLNTKRGFLKKIKYIFHPENINLFKLYKHRGLLKETDIYIDNQKLDGFLEYYFKGNNIAYVDDEKYCQEIAQKVLSFDEKARVNQIKELTRFIDSLKSGDMFF